MMNVFQYSYGFSKSIFVKLWPSEISESVMFFTPCASNKEMISLFSNASISDSLRL